MAANGKRIENEGQKTIEFLTKSQDARQMTFQCAPANNMLACIGEIADANNYILFGPTNGHVLNLDEETKAAIEALIKNCRQKTEFDRKGNVYVMDAYVKLKPGSQLAKRVDSLRSKLNHGFFGGRKRMTMMMQRLRCCSDHRATTTIRTGIRCSTE